MNGISRITVWKTNVGEWAIAVDGPHPASLSDFVRRGDLPGLFSVIERNGFEVVGDCTTLNGRRLIDVRASANPDWLSAA